MISITTNAEEIAAKYYKRASDMLRYADKPHEFAIALHQLRIVNLDKLIYVASPYIGTKNAPTGSLKEGEKVMGNTVFNDCPHADIRRKMTGDYKISQGQSRAADWEKISFVEILPLLRNKEGLMRIKS